MLTRWVPWARSTASRSGVAVAGDVSTDNAGWVADPAAAPSRHRGDDPEQVRQLLGGQVGQGAATDRGAGEGGRPQRVAYRVGLDPQLSQVAADLFGRRVGPGEQVAEPDRISQNGRCR